MENTIMTEKIARRGVKTPNAYHPDVLEKLTVEHVLKSHQALLDAETSVEQVRQLLLTSNEKPHNYYIVVNADGSFKGIISLSNIMSMQHDVAQPIGSLIRRKLFTIQLPDSLKTAASMMARENLDVLPVTNGSDIVIGILTYRDILSAYEHYNEEHRITVPISLKRKTLKVFVRRRQRLSSQQ